jgi:hypothetical protein
MISQEEFKSIMKGISKDIQKNGSGVYCIDWLILEISFPETKFLEISFPETKFLENKKDKWVARAHHSYDVLNKNIRRDVLKDIVFEVDIFGNYTVSNSYGIFNSCSGSSTIGRYELLFICISDHRTTGGLKYEGDNYEIYLPIYPRLTDKTSFCSLL